MMIIKWHVIKSNKDLPRADKYVLVTRIVRGRRLVDIDTPEPLHYYSRERDPYTGWRDTFASNQVIAWTELPEPYQGKLK